MKTIKQLKEAHSSRRSRDKNHSGKRFKDDRAAGGGDVLRDPDAHLPTEEKPGYLKIRWTKPIPTSPKK